MLSDHPPAIHVYRGEQIREFVPYLNEKAIQLGRQFPYLYIPLNETPPNYLLAEDPNAFAVFSGETAVLAAHPLVSSCLESKYSPRSTLDALQEQGFDLSHILYFAFFWVADEKRQDYALIERVYQEAASMGRQMGMTHACYFITLREEDHPLKPIPYIFPEPWDALSPPFCDTKITFTLCWPTLQPDGSVKEGYNLQTLFIREL